MVQAPMTSRINGQASRTTALTGDCTGFCALAMSSNSGDSCTPRRITKASSSNSTLPRNGRRQPHAYMSASGISVMKRNTISDSTRPAGLPSWANEA
ncbi:hypothetical protein D3C76_1271600 [compost metagenome]